MPSIMTPMSSHPSYPSLSTLIGNITASRRAMRMIQSGQIPQSLLITGPCPLAIEEFAKAFAGSVLTRHERPDSQGSAQGSTQGSTQGSAQAKLQSGNHPDLYILRPEGKGNQYTVETIRQFNSLLVLPPTEAKHKVFILLEAERMLPVSANALLKSIEEPMLDAVILLVSTASQLLLPTIRSRCQSIVLRSLTDDEVALWLMQTMKVDRKVAQNHARLAEGSQWRAHALASGEVTYQNILLPLLQAMSQGHATYLHIHEVAEKLTAVLGDQVKQPEIEKSTDDEKSTDNNDKDYLSPQQRHAQEKREEGASASLLREAFNLLCMHILAYFRDLQAIEVGVSTESLYYPNYPVDCQRMPSAQRPSVLSAAASYIERVESRIELANALLDRFTPLKTCIETLFLH